MLDFGYDKDKEKKVEPMLEADEFDKQHREDLERIKNFRLRKGCRLCVRLWKI